MKIAGDGGSAGDGGVGECCDDEHCPDEASKAICRREIDLCLAAGGGLEGECCLIGGDVCEL